MSIDERHYNFRVDGVELALLIRALDVLIKESKAAGWLAVQDLFEQRQREAEVLKTKLEHAKSA